jgi:hypothetical protein
MNDLTTIDDSLFEDLKGLEILELGNNNISSLSITVFSELANLKNLSLDHNQLKKIDANLFSLKNLKELTLNHNQLTDIDTELIQKTCLDNLTLNNNNFKRNLRAVKFFSCMIVLDLDKKSKIKTGDDNGGEKNAAVNTVLNGWFTKSCFLIILIEYVFF